MNTAAKVAHTEIDRLFLERVQSGALSILVSGVVINTKTGRQIAHAGKICDLHIQVPHPEGRRRGITRAMRNTRLLYLVYHGEIPEGYEIYVDDSMDPTLLMSARLKIRKHRNGRSAGRTVHANGKIDREKVVLYRKRYHCGLLIGRELARDIGCSHPTVSHMLNGKTFKREGGPTETYLDGITTMKLAAGMTLEEAEEEFGMTEAEHLTAISRYAHLLDDLE